MERITKGLHLAAAAALAVIARPFVGLVPRRRNLWAFGSWGGTRYADNARYAYLQAKDERDIDVVWITSSRSVYQELRRSGLPVTMKLSPSGLWAAIRAGVYVFDVSPKDINFTLSRGAYLVNLWHGTPLKKIERCIDTPGHYFYEGLTGNPLARLLLFVRAPWIAIRYDLIVTTSTSLRPLFARAFGVSTDRVVSCGYPRNDRLMAAATAVSPKTTLLYMPTFRDGGKSFSWSRREFNEINALCAAHNAMLQIKLHPLDNSSKPLQPLDNVKFVDKTKDAYELLPNCSALITDYSSVFFDYLLLDRPLIFYCHDLNEYLERDRGMNFDYHQVTPGAKAYTFAELLREISYVLNGEDRYASIRAEVIHQFHDHVDNSSAKRLIEEVRVRAIVR